ncbi:MAG TPA: hypothetical protein VMG82_30410 [Candidatus Sulfotelmatobacter sp.]|nr:hypothetical protein [Candidatus Sulfotelmatobacter sp.]
MADLHRDIEKHLRRPESWEVWAEISYLDSASDYREYLGQNEPGYTGYTGGLVMLDTSRPFSKSKDPLRTLITIGVVLLLACAGLLCVLLYPMW